MRALLAFSTFNDWIKDKLSCGERFQDMNLPSAGLSVPGPDRFELGGSSAGRSCFSSVPTVARDRWDPSNRGLPTEPHRYSLLSGQ